MKKLFLLLGIVCTFSSCMTIRSSATHKTVDVQPIGVLIADLEVSPKRITYTMNPHKRIQRGGYENIKSTAIREALRKNGGGDVLVALEIQTRQVRFLAWRKITSITVSGYPATYKNFTCPDKSYWTAEALWLTQDAIEKSKSGNKGIFSGIAGTILDKNK